MRGKEFVNVRSGTAILIIRLVYRNEPSAGRPPANQPKFPIQHPFGALRPQSKAQLEDALALKCVVRTAVSFVALLSALPGLAATFTEIKVPNSASTEAFCINNLSQIVGDYSTSAGQLRGFVLTNGTYSDVVYPGSNFTIATGINDYNVISGYYVDSANQAHGFIDNAGTFTQIDYPGATSTQAMSISNTGIVVGYYWDANNQSHGFVLHSGQFSKIQGPNATHTAVLGINKFGAIVGYYIDTSGFTHGFEKSAGKFVTIDHSGSVITSVASVNVADTKTGYYAANNTDVGFILQNSKYTAFTYPRASATLPNSINNAGAIVGTYTDSSNIAHGFLRQ